MSLLPDSVRPLALQLNCLAVERMRRTGNFASALQYARAALQLLPPDSWKTDLALTRRVHFNGILMEQAAGNEAAGAALIAVTLANCDRSDPRIYVPFTLVRMVQQTLAGNYEPLVDRMVAAMAGFYPGLMPDPAGDPNALATALLERMGGARTAVLLTLPQCDEKERVFPQLQILMGLAPALSRCRPKLWMVHIVTMVSHMLQFGFHAAGMYAYPGKPRDAFSHPMTRSRTCAAVSPGLCAEEA
jgi:hypothetical protein